MKKLTLSVVLSIVGMISFAQDIQSLESRAELGDAEAQFRLCRYYVSMDDNTTAFSYLLQAAENEYPEALYELGCCYKDGALGLPVWNEKAKEYLFRANELGCDKAKAKLDQLTEEYNKPSRKVIRRRVYKQIISVAPQSQQSKFSDKMREFIRQ